MKTRGGASRGPSSRICVTPPLTLTNCMECLLYGAFGDLLPASLSKPAANGAAKALVAFVEARLGRESNRCIRRAKQIIVSPLNDFEKETMLESRRINVEEFTALVSIIEYAQAADLL